METTLAREFVEVCLTGNDLERVRELLADGVDIDTPDKVKNHF
jgi:hypothetical protein